MEPRLFDRIVTDLSAQLSHSDILPTEPTQSTSHDQSTNSRKCNRHHPAIPMRNFRYAQFESRIADAPGRSNGSDRILAPELSFIQLPTRSVSPQSPLAPKKLDTSPTDYPNSSDSQCSPFSNHLHFRCVQTNGISDHPNQINQTSDRLQSFCSSDDLLASPNKIRNNNYADNSGSIFDSRPQMIEPLFDIPNEFHDRKRWRKSLKCSSTLELPLPKSFQKSDYLDKMNRQQPSLVVVKILLPSDSSTPGLDRHSRAVSSYDISSRVPSSDSLGHQFPRRSHAPSLIHEKGGGLSGFLQLGSQIHFRRTFGSRTFNKFRKQILMGHAGISPDRLSSHGTSLRESPPPDVLLTPDRGQNRIISSEAEHTAGQPPLTGMKFESDQIAHEINDKMNDGTPNVRNLTHGMDITFHQSSPFDDRIRSGRPSDSHQSFDDSVEAGVRHYAKSDDYWDSNNWNIFDNGTPHSSSPLLNPQRNQFSVHLSSLLHRGFSTSVWLCRSHTSKDEISKVISEEFQDDNHDEVVDIVVPTDDPSNEELSDTIRSKIGDITEIEREPIEKNVIVMKVVHKMK